MEEIKRFRVLIAIVVVLGLGAVAWYAFKSKTGDSPAEEGQAAPELPEIEQDELTEITIERPEDDAPVRLVKSGETWRLAAPVDAPAARTNVDTLLEKLGGLELEGVAAQSARQHERLEVDAEHGVHVIARAGSEEVIDLWIGAFRGGNTMVRLDGSDDVLMVRGSIKFAFNRAANEWRDRAIVELEANSGREVTFANTNGTFRFRKNGENWEQVLEPAAEGEDPPAGIENFDATKVRTAVSMAERLRASDFAAPDVTRESAGLGEGAARVTLVSGEGDAAQTTVIVIGNEVENGTRYAMREGSDTIYVIARSNAERLIPNAEAFQQSDEPEEPAEPPPGMPGGMPGMPPGGGGGQIPPELMEQIQRQLQQQGGHP
jgi:hypothetical protein